MEITPFSEPWIDGFVGEAADLGLGPAQAEALLKQASFMALMQDANFSTGYAEELQKQGAPIAPSLIGRIGGALWRNAPAIAATGAGMYGARKGYEALQRNWRRSPEEANLIGMMQDNPANVDAMSNAFQTRDSNRMSQAMAQMMRQKADWDARRQQMEAMTSKGRSYDPFSFRGN